MDLGKEVKSGRAWSMGNDVGGGGREMGGGNEVMNSGGHNLLVVRRMGWRAEGY